MTFKIPRSFLVAAVCAAPVILAQGTLADYKRAQGLQAKARNLVVNAPGPVSWIGAQSRSPKRRSDAFWIL